MIENPDRIRSMLGNGCYGVAMQVYLERHNIDTNKMIVAMFGNPGHVYYRSDEWIEQKTDLPLTKSTNIFNINQGIMKVFNKIPAYVGHPGKAPPPFYEEGTFTLDKITTAIIDEYVRKFVKSR